MKSFTLSYNGKEWNEDFAYSCENFQFVLDGASAVSTQKYSNYASDAQWYSFSMGNYLVENLGDTQNNVFNILKNGVKTLKKEYCKLSHNEKIVDFPSATLSLARINNDNVEFYTLSDSIIIVEDKFGNVFEIYDSRNNVNDNIRMSYAMDIAKKENISVSEARKKYPFVIADGRKLRNTTGHQFVLADDLNAVDEGISFSMPIKLVNKVIILSDGFSQCFDLFKFVNKERFIKSINSKEDAIKFYKKLIKLQNKDSNCQKYLRFKKTDDASLACWIFD